MVFQAPSRRKRLLPLLVLLAVRSMAAFEGELGSTLVRSFSRAEHQAHAQFWAPFQTAEGLMYFGNQLAVLEYDGRTWRVLRVPLPMTRALASAPNGDIYVGDEEQLGFLAEPSSGPAQFTSLLERVPADAKPFGIVRDVRVWRGGVFFATDKNVLRWQNDAFHVWPFPSEHRNRLFVAGDRLILHRVGEGLYEFDGDRFASLSTAAPLRQAGGSFVVAHANSRLLMGLGDQGLFEIERDGTLTPWPNEANEILDRTEVLSGMRLRGNEIAIGTTSDGVVILSQDGKLLRHLTRANGLPHATAFSLGEDREGGLWVGTNNGPARALWRSPATVFQHGGSGISDARLSDMVRHRGEFFYLSTDGLYRLKPASAPGQPARFERDTRVDMEASFSSLLSHSGGLLLASGKGLQRLGENGPELLVPIRDGASELAASTSESRRVFYSHAAGVGAGTFTPSGTWQDEGAIPGLQAECTDVVEDDQGALWVGTMSRGVFRATRPTGAPDWRTAQVTLLTPADGLPPGHGAIYVQATSVGVLFDTAQGIYRFDPRANRFVAYRELTAFDSRQIVLNPIAAGAPGEIWTNGILMTKEIPYPLLRLRARAGGQFSAELPPQEIQDFFTQSAPHRIYWEPTDDSVGVVWAKSDSGLLRIDLQNFAPPPPPPAPLIRQIVAEGRAIVFPREGPGQLQLEFSREPMTITFASGRFRATERERFQTRLVGFNAEWTEPTGRNDVTYTNLEGGPFRFEVRNVDRQGGAGPATAFSFRVTPAWQRSPAAYVAYAVLALGLMWAFVRWRLARAERERARLEALVAKRTAELDAANKAKSLFLANMSHELRTPLNGVIGYAQVLQKSPQIADKDRERLRIVQASGEHLLRMINEVLDFSKIEAGKLELRAGAVNLRQLLRDVAATHAARAEQKGLSLHVDANASLPEVVIADGQKLRQVLDNLLSNAVKFTAHGRVELRANRAERDRVEFSVSDTGVGIGASDRDRLFQPFQQAEAGRPAEPGTGLGLAISRRIVELMGGTLQVESEVGRGTTFTFALELPAGDAREAPPSHATIVGYHGPRRRLLIVDDIEVNRGVVRDLLEPLGFELDEAADGKEALRRVAEFQPELVFLDLRMSGMDGFEFARVLRDTAGAGRRPKLLAMSASALSINRADAVAAGCDDFLAKPFHERELLGRVAALLDITWMFAAATPQTVAAPREAGVDPEILDALLATAQRGEVARLRKQIGELRAAHPTFASELEPLLAAYRMEDLRAMLQRHRESRASRNLARDNSPT